MSPIVGRFLTRDPIGFTDSASLYTKYLELAEVDPEGLCAKGSSCVVDELDIIPPDRTPKVITGLMPNGDHFYGNAFLVTTKVATRSKCHEMMGNAAVLMLILLLNGCEPRAEAGRNERCRSNIACLRKCKLTNPWNDKIRVLCSPS